MFDGVSPKTHVRYSTYLMTVATRLAAIRTVTSRPRLAEWSRASDPEVRASPMPNAIRPLTWCRAALTRPLMPNVRRRFAAVLATAVMSRLITLAAWADITSRSSR